MTGAILALCVSTLIGALVVRAIGAVDARRSSIAGEAVLIGVGSTALVLELLSICAISWSPGSVAVALIAVAAALWWIGGRRGGVRGIERAEWNASAIPLDISTVFLVAGYVIFTTLVRLPEHDFLAIWGLKGRAFWEAHGIDWQFLTRSSNDFSHPDYPLLVPLAFDFVSLFRGAWEDRWIGLVYPAVGAGALLVVRAELSRICRSPFLVSLATFALAGLALTPWVGLGDGVVAVYAVAALSLLRGGVDRDDWRSVARGSVLLGFAAMTKNEGVATLVAYGAAFVVASGTPKRSVAHLWPALVIPLPWWIARAVLRIDSGILRGSLIHRVAENLSNPQAVIRALAMQHIVSAWAVAGIFLALALALSRRVAQRETFALSAVALQGALYVAAYFIASYELEWLVRWSWERVASQFVLPLAFVACALALRSAEER